MTSYGNTVFSVRITRPPTDPGACDGCSLRGEACQVEPGFRYTTYAEKKERSIMRAGRTLRDRLYPRRLGAASRTIHADSNDTCYGCRCRRVLCEPRRTAPARGDSSDAPNAPSSLTGGRSRRPKDGHSIVSCTCAFFVRPGVWQNDPPFSEST